MFQRIYDKIREYETIIIHRHSKPDPDALGSQFGLKHAILNTFPDKKVFAVGDSIPKYKFMGDMDNVNDETYESSLVIVVDTGATSLISDDRYNNGDYLIKIDHHINREDYGDICFVLESYSSTCEIISDLIKETDLVMHKKVATLLYSGLITDTGRFLYPSVSKNTFKVASYLLDFDIDFVSIYDSLYEQNPNFVKLKGYFMLNYQTTEYGVAYMKNKKELIDEFNVDFFGISRGMVNTMSNIKGIDIWVNFTENPENNKIVMELRAKKLPVVDVAIKYGGGGHKLACGATLDSWDKVDEVLEDLNELTRGV